MLCACDPFDFLPFFIRQESAPGTAHRRLIGPGQQIHKLCPFIGFCFSHCKNIEAVGLHDPHGMVTEALVERGFITKCRIKPRLRLEFGPQFTAKSAVIYATSGTFEDFVDT
jgi:hypothetical protein